MYTSALISDSTEAGGNRRWFVQWYMDIGKMTISAYGKLNNGSTRRLYKRIMDIHG